MLTSPDAGAGAGSMARSSPRWPSAPGAILSYAVAVLAVAAAAVAGLLLDRFLQTVPFVSLFLCAILFAAWLGGAGPACSQPDSPFWLSITISFLQRIRLSLRTYRASPFLP